MTRGSAALARSLAPAPGPILILAALQGELAVLRRMTVVARRLTIDRCPASLGRLEGVPVILASTGDGAGRASRGATAILDRLPASRVIVVGLSGGLTPSLEAGRLLVGRDVIEGGVAAPPPDAAWIDRAILRTGATPATLVSSRQILCTAGAKTKAREDLESGAIAAVDLESAAFARAAAARGIPYLALRAISDTAEESLPLDFNRLRGADGSVDRLRVAIRALLRPALIPRLWRLRGRAALCSENLARAVRALLAGGAP
jgi:adenosylhomocysteine nucleosidase